MATQAIEKLRLLNGGATPGEAQIAIELDTAYERMLASAPTFKGVPKQFLTQYPFVEPVLLSSANDVSVLPSNPLPILSRATLLLRMATGISRQLLIDAGYSVGSELDFWFSQAASDFGFVEAFADISGDRTSLYLDCAIATEDLAATFRSTAPPLHRATLMRDRRVMPHTACEANRIPQWGLQP